MAGLFRSSPQSVRARASGRSSRIRDASNVARSRVFLGGDAFPVGASAGAPPAHRLERPGVQP
jgi:hypothetical protein